MRLKGLDRPERVINVEPVEPLPQPPVLAREIVGRPRWAVLSALAVVALLVAGMVGLVIHDRAGSAKTGPLVIHVRRDSIAAIDPQSGRVLADPHADLSGFAPNIAGGDGPVWTY